MVKIKYQQLYVKTQKISEKMSKKLRAKAQMALNQTMRLPPHLPKRLRIKELKLVPQKKASPRKKRKREVMQRITDLLKQWELKIMITTLNSKTRSG